MATPERIINVAKRLIIAKSRGESVVVVVSAMGNSTNKLIELANEISAHPDAREYDALVSTGENVSAALLAMALIERGCPALSLNGAQAGIRTTDLYSRAKIMDIDCSRILSEIEAGKIVVVTGFQGVTPHDDITTIGRGGSDTSAVALAAALKAKTCHICTDVDGVYTTDPRVVPEARKLPVISYDEMLELASLGAKVLHPRSVEFGKQHQIELVVRSSFSDDPGTLVKEISEMEEGLRPVTGVTVDLNQARIAILKVPDRPGVAGKLFGHLAKNAVNVDMIIQSIEQDEINSITFTVHKNDLAIGKKVSEDFANEVGAQGVVFEDNIAKLSIVGVGMISKPGVAATMFKALGEHNINLKHIATSEIKISCVIDQSQAAEAVKCLHAAFELEKEAV